MVSKLDSFLTLLVAIILPRVAYFLDHTVEEMMQ